VDIELIQSRIEVRPEFLDGARSFRLLGSERHDRDEDGENGGKAQTDHGLCLTMEVFE
jgi:hypothetical protein